MDNGKHEAKVELELSSTSYKNGALWKKHNNLCNLLKLSLKTFFIMYNWEQVWHIRNAFLLMILLVPVWKIWPLHYTSIHSCPWCIAIKKVSRDSIVANLTGLQCRLQLSINFSNKQTNNFWDILHDREWAVKTIIIVLLQGARIHL